MVPFQKPYGGQNQDHNDILVMEVTVETMNYTHNHRLSMAYSDFKENHDLHELRSQGL